MLLSSLFVQMIISVSEWMFLYQLSIRTIDSPKNFRLFLSWWNSFTKQTDIKDMINEGKLHKIKKTHFSLRSYEGSDSNQAEHLHGWQESPSNFTERKISFLFQNDFGIPFKPFFSKTLTRQLKGAVWVNYQSAAAPDLLQAAGCCHPGHTGQCSFGGPCTTSAGDLMALGKFVESHLPRIGWVGTYVSYWHLLTIELRKPNRKPICFVWGVCEWAEWMNLFFWGGDYIYICSVIYIYTYMYISSTIRIAYCWEYNILYLSQTSSQRSGLSLCRVYTPQQHPHIKRKMRRRNHHPPKTRHGFIWVVCVCP